MELERRKEETEVKLNQNENIIGRKKKRSSNKTEEKNIKFGLVDWFSDMTTLTVLF